MPKQKGEVKVIIPVAIALAILFILFSTMIVPFFSATYEYGFGTEPCAKTGCTSSSSSASLINSYCSGYSTAVASDVACTGCNATSGYATFLSTCGTLRTWNNATHCQPCTNFGFKSVSIGLILFILVIAMVFFAVTFLKATKFEK